MKAKWKEKRGDFTINGILILLLVLVLLILAISTIGVCNRAIRLHTVAAELTRYIEIRGQVDAPVYEELARLEAAAGIRVDCDITATYITGTSKIQFGESFRVTLSCDTRFGVGGIVSVPISLESTVTGRGEQYWPR